MGTQGGECQGQVGPCVGVQGSLISPVGWRTPPSGHLPSPKRNLRCLGALPGGAAARLPEKLLTRSCLKEGLYLLTACVVLKWDLPRGLTEASVSVGAVGQTPN